MLLTIEPFYYALLGLLGLCVGSFLNVLILRLPDEQSLVLPASHCVQCAQALRWYHNIPVVSYIFLKGRCGFCKKPISLQYPIIEVITAFVFIAVGRKYFPLMVPLVRDLPILSIFIAITFIDLRHQIIPDVLSLGGWLYALLTLCFGSQLAPQVSLAQGVIGGVVGAGMFFLTAYLYFRFKKCHGLGGGDIKLLGLIGAFLGIQGLFATILISSTAGTLVGLCVAMLQKKRGQDILTTAIAFGPFLILGALVYYFFMDFVGLRYESRFLF